MIWITHLMVITGLLIVSMKLKNEQLFINTSFIYALFVFGQRWMTGTDFPNYLRYYLIDFQVNEPLYYGLQNILAVNNIYFGFLIFIILFITLFNQYLFLTKINRHVALMVFLFLLSETFFAQLSQIRQFVAISFFLLAYYNVYFKQYWKVVLNLVLGAAFHTSIIFLVPFMFIRLRLNRVKCLYLLTVSAILPLLDMSLLINLPVFDRYSHYLDSIFNVNLSVFHYLRYYVILGVITLFVWFIKEFRNTNMDQMILNGLIFNMLLYGMSFQFALIFRVSMYFKIFEIVFLVYYHKELLHFSKSIIRTGIVLLTIGIYGGLALTDPYMITRYEFRSLRWEEERTVQELNTEIVTFYD